jgi:PAS domain S-box-containing protein
MSKSEQARRTTEARSDAYLRAALDCVVMADASGRVVEFNPAAERTFGYTREEALGRTLAELIVPPWLRERHNRAFARFVETREERLFGRRLELTGMRADGREFPVELALSRVEGEPLLICGALRDISEARRADDDLRRLADEQAALHRVATLVAGNAPAEDLFAAVAEEAALILDVPYTLVHRFELDATSTLIGARGHLPMNLGDRFPLDAPSVMASVQHTGRPARINDYTEIPGPLAALARKAGIRSAVGVPVIVNDRTWGAIVAADTETAPLPDSTEGRLAGFTELVATAIANTQARDEIRRLANQQAALRRVATLVANQAPPEELFAAVAEEVAQVTGIPLVDISRYEPDTSTTVVGAWGDHPFSVGTRWQHEAGTLSALVLQTRRPARIHDYAEISGAIAAAAQERGGGTAVGVPILVSGIVWGVVAAGWTDRERLPEDTELRLAEFTELVATAISNTQARDDLRELASEQAALRRVATLVARRARPAEVFAAVTEEVGKLLEAEVTQLYRYEDAYESVRYVASWTRSGVSLAFPARLTLEGRNLSAMIRDTGLPARIDDYSQAVGSVGDQLVRPLGIRAGIGCPVIVDGVLWGTMAVATFQPEPFPPGAEARLAAFTELVATAMSNADTHSALMASRARIVTAGDEARRRIERDLHDGTQQRLVSLGLELQSVKAQIPGELRQVHTELGRVEQVLEGVLDDVREISRGLHPAILSQAGLAPALKTLARRSAVPVEIEVDVEGRLPESIEVAAYYVVSEALANAAKHAHASVVYVSVTVSGAWLHATVRDDGVGGAAATDGSGLVGLEDRVEALGGRFTLESPPGEGTKIAIELPLAGATDYLETVRLS